MKNNISNANFLQVFEFLKQKNRSQLVSPKDDVLAQLVFFQLHFFKQSRDCGWLFDEPLIVSKRCIQLGDLPEVDLQNPTLKSLYSDYFSKQLSARRKYCRAYVKEFLSKIVGAQPLYILTADAIDLNREERIWLRSQHNKK